MNPRDAFDYLIAQIREQTEDDSSRYIIPDHLAKPLLNYQSIRHDLIFIKEATTKLMTPDLDQTTMASLWHTVIALYGKCFVSSGHSTKLESNNCFSRQNEMFLKTHNELMDLRHNFVAHRGRTIHEFAIAYIKIDPFKNDSEVKIEQLKRNKPDIGELEKYIQLFDHLITVTEDKIRTVGHKVVKKLFSTTNPNQLYKI
ncbi:MAG: hypothetical protein HYR67_07455 [Bacteroidetes bacterium]|nr:hypothetical protein [Bacteroidota bacterium]